MTIPLLEYLAYRMGCGYLSDLHALRFSARFRYTLSLIALDDCAEAEWLEAARYLCPDEGCASAGEARDALLA